MTDFNGIFMTSQLSLLQFIAAQRLRSHFTASVKGMFTKCSLKNHIWSSLVRST
jgi:hypothetical protein